MGFLLLLPIVTVSAGLWNIKKATKWLNLQQRIKQFSKTPANQLTSNIPNNKRDDWQMCRPNNKPTNK
jgi:cytochrome oxidase assembly protein ShyY1